MANQEPDISNPTSSLIRKLYKPRHLLTLENFSLLIKKVNSFFWEKKYSLKFIYYFLVGGIKLRTNTNQYLFKKNKKKKMKNRGKKKKAHK